VTSCGLLDAFVYAPILSEMQASDFDVSLIGIDMVSCTAQVSQLDTTCRDERHCSSTADSLSLVLQPSRMAQPPAWWFVPVLHTAFLS